MIPFTIFSKKLLLIFFFIGNIVSYEIDDSSKVKHDYGPERKTVYKLGTPGGQWTKEEIDTTRSRILIKIAQMRLFTCAQFSQKLAHRFCSNFQGT